MPDWTSIARSFSNADEKASPRRLRLFACACVRRVWRLLSDERSRRAVEIAELIADENLNAPEQVKGKQEANAAALDAWHRLEWSSEYEAAMAAFYTLVNTANLGFAAAFRARCCLPRGDRDDERNLQASILRDIFGNPFRPAPTLNPSLLTPSIVSLAQSIYDERRFERLPELASRLQEAGCQDQELLGHVQTVGPHVKGCWALDLVLGRDYQEDGEGIQLLFGGRT